MTFPVTPSRRRRVLSDQSTNAYIQPRGQDNSNNQNHNKLTNKESADQKPWSFSRLQNNEVVACESEGTRPKVGQKRSIDLVDGIEEYGHMVVKQGMPSIMMEHEDVVTCTIDDEEDGKVESECESEGEGEMECALKMDYFGETKSESECKMKVIPKKEEDVETKSECKSERKCAIKKEEDDESESESKTKGTLTKIEIGETTSKCESETKAAPKKEDDSESKATMDVLSASFHASQEGPPPLEEQFDIQEEASQQTLESLNATPLPVNTSQPQTHKVAKMPTEGSQDSVGMSKFVDFGGQGDEGEDMKMLLPIHTLPWYSERRPAMDEIAGVLRSRLQLAHYRVQTNQIYTPFSQLARFGTPPPSPPPQAKDEEDLIWAAKGEYTDQKKPGVQDLKSLPTPAIYPTAFSARFPDLPRQRVVDAERFFPSPATSRSGSHAGSSVSNIATQRNTPVQPTVSPETGSGTLAEGTASRQSGEDATSSASKDEAANGLLELIRAAAES